MLRTQDATTDGIILLNVYFLNYQSILMAMKWHTLADQHYKTD